MYEDSGDGPKGPSEQEKRMCTSNGLLSRSQSESGLYFRGSKSDRYVSEKVGFALTFSPAESEFEKILRENGFMTATPKTSVKAPSIQGEPGHFIIIPDIIAVDGKGNGWCFEVKDEAASTYCMRRIEMTHGYTGPAWFL